MGFTSVGLSLSLNSEPGFTRKSSELILIFHFPVMVASLSLTVYFWDFVFPVAGLALGLSAASGLSVVGLTVCAPGRWHE
jgi:hypothetical protein